MISSRTLTGNASGNIAPIGVPPVSNRQQVNNTSNLHNLGNTTTNGGGAGGAFSSSITGGLHPLLNNTNDGMNTSLGLASMPTSSAAGGATGGGGGFGTSQISSHFSDLTGIGKFLSLIVGEYIRERL